MKFFVWTGLIWLLSVTANAQVYKWVDENGKTQYTDQPPPPGVSREKQRLNLKSVSAPTNNAINQSKTLSEERLEFDKRQQQKKEEEAKQLAKAEENKKKCIDAQSRLRMYSDSPRLTIPDGSGGIAYVDDDMRQKRINEANQAIATFCNKQASEN
ncbi:DUF4124 domain-containing protein [Nitrosomonas sp. Nm166]|uniref:DUF4124 domain-containing protein n=1 Tax=Nitrosomonas sp. Nm166 TaxID=1881054 RepID=UPI0008E26798|nr:DUF4124 domain-containing protein [Nitrosomonas sp. Nm166]SFE67882.1 protein of unknown function [Nitrosomonas sp. Nm166]